MPAEEVPADEAPAEAAPAEETSTDETPPAETPTDGLPTVEDAPADESPAPDAPADDAAPAEAAPADDENKERPDRTSTFGRNPVQRAGFLSFGASRGVGSWDRGPRLLIKLMTYSMPVRTVRHDPERRRAVTLFEV